jgi:hypothetical protein
MIRNISTKIVRNTLTSSHSFSGLTQGSDFLTMVESYFDNAGTHTNIRADYLNFYKKADNVVKFNLTLVRGKDIKLLQMMEKYK